MLYTVLFSFNLTTVADFSTIKKVIDVAFPFFVPFVFEFSIQKGV